MKRSLAFISQSGYSVTTQSCHLINIPSMIGKNDCTFWTMTITVLILMFNVILDVSSFLLIHVTFSPITFPDLMVRSMILYVVMRAFVDRNFWFPGISSFLFNILVMWIYPTGYWIWPGLINHLTSWLYKSLYSCLPLGCVPVGAN